jgi:hypothetical protein
LAGTRAALVDAPLTLWIEPYDGAVTLRSPIGDLTVHSFHLAITVADELPSWGDDLDVRREGWR